MSKKCRAYSESKLGLEPTDNRKAFYAGWDAALAQQEEGGGNLPPPLPAEPEPETCTWHQDGDSDSGVYATSCRHYFNLEDGTPEDNKLAWCCYCGKKLTQELITEGGDD